MSIGIDEQSMPILAALIKGDPLVNVAGAYLPAWLVCLAVGGIATWLLHLAVKRSAWREVLRPGAVMVPAVFVALTCGTWMIFFASR